MNDLLTKNLAFLLAGDGQAQTTIADKIGVTQGTVSKWSKLYERGSKSEPEFRGMARLAAALGISLDDLARRDLEGEGISPPTQLHQNQSQPVRLDPARLALAIGTFEGALQDANRVLDPDRKARIISLLYADPGIPDTREAFEAAIRGYFLAME